MATRTRAPKPPTPSAEPPADPTLQAALIAARAADSKKATGLRLLDLRPVTTFADFFVICSGSNQRQIQAIAEAVRLEVKEDAGLLPIGVEGFDKAEWILVDYGDFLVHVFSEQARGFYDLERLWRAAPEVPLPTELQHPA